MGRIRPDVLARMRAWAAHDSGVLIVTVNNYSMAFFKDQIDAAEDDAALEEMIRTRYAART